MNALVDPGTLELRLPDWAAANRSWLVAAIGALRTRMARSTCTGDGERLDCVETVEARGFTPALLHCAQVFRLSPFERELLLLAAGLEMDPDLRRVVTGLNRGTSALASYQLALDTLISPHWDALSPDAPLRYWRVLVPEPGGPHPLAPLRLDERVLHFIAGVPAADVVLASVITLIRPGTRIDDQDSQLVRRVALVLQTWTTEVGPVLVLQDASQDAAAQRDIALGVATWLARCAMWIEARDLPTDPGALSLLARHVDREVALSGALPVLAADGATERAQQAALALVARLRSSVLWLGTGSAGLTGLPQDRTRHRFDLPTPSATRTRNGLKAIWGRHLLPDAVPDSALDAAFDCAARQFHLGATALSAAVETIRAVEAADRAAAVWPAVRIAARGELDDLAQRIDTQVHFDDLVLPKGQAAIVRDVARHLRHREQVYRQWGFGAKHRLGQGLVALFAGESGTGKTLAAEAIANDVELDLYRVDLAMVVSKYIGETEKNLKRLFDAAERSGSVLLFDEADALFGKRSEVKDSHDRYANIEVAYLLQRVEAYRGLAILTTNMKGALDRAFLRRIRFVVTFPFPDTTARETIWRRQIPPEAPTGDIDFAALARLTLAGGNIRNIVLNAAFKAADANSCIDQPTLMLAAHEELAKLERSTTLAKGGS